jgi:hypothetical protein
MTTTPRSVRLKTDQAQTVLFVNLKRLLIATRRQRAFEFGRAHFFNGSTVTLMGEITQWIGGHVAQ